MFTWQEVQAAFLFGKLCCEIVYHLSFIVLILSRSVHIIPKILFYPPCNSFCSI